MYHDLPKFVWMDAAFWMCILGIGIWMIYCITAFRKLKSVDSGQFPDLMDEVDVAVFIPQADIIHPEFEVLSRHEQIRRFGRILYNWQLEIGKFAILNDLNGSFRMQEIVEVMEIKQDDDDPGNSVGMWHMRIKVAEHNAIERIYLCRRSGDWRRV